jgi:signal transduction histidine kinase
MPPSAPPRPAERSPSSEDLLTIVRLLPDVIFKCVKDADGTIRWTLNEGRLAEEFHLTTKDVYGKSLREMFPPGAAEVQEPFFEAAFRGEAKEWVHELGGRLFKHFPQPVRDASGRVVAVVGFITDVTGLVQAEEQAKRLNQELLVRLAQLQDANRRLAQANRDLDAFAAMASHDLRNPLNVVALNARALAKAVAGEARQAEAARRIQDAGKRMADLTADLLRFARAGADAFRPADVDVGALAREVAADLAAQDPSRAVAWDLGQGVHAHADAGLLRVALANLMGNAWKYTAKTAAPRIAVTATRTSWGDVEVAVADNGPGFEPADAADLFQAFHRLRGSEGFAGTGLGLATVRRIVERHGGRVWAESAPGEGATFRFTIPGPAPPAPDSAASAAAVPVAPMVAAPAAA